MTTQIFESSDLPNGVYNVFYYRTQGIKVVRARAFDSNVGREYVAALQVEPNEIAIATCQSQPGGATIYGSPSAREAWLLSDDTEEAQSELNRRARRGKLGPWRWEITECDSSHNPSTVIRFLASEGAGDPVLHSCTRGDLYRFAADPSQAGEWARLPWAEVSKHATSVGGSVTIPELEAAAETAYRQYAEAARALHDAYWERLQEHLPEITKVITARYPEAVLTLEQTEWTSSDEFSFEHWVHIQLPALSSEEEEQFYTWLAAEIPLAKERGVTFALRRF